MVRQIVCVLAFLSSCSCISITNASNKECDSLPFSAAISNPNFVDGKSLVLTGVVGYKKGVTSVLYMDNYSYENVIVENSVQLNVDSKDDMFEKIDGKLAIICGVIKKETKDKHFNLLGFERIDYIRVGVAEWRNGTWEL